MDILLLERMRAHVTENEVPVETPYRDSAGNLTAGIGFKTSTPDAFTRLPFQVKDAETGEMRYATEAEKRAEFDRVKSMGRNQLEDEASQEGSRSFRLTNADMNKVLDGEIAERIGKIKNEVGAEAWDRLSDGQKTAVLDVHYANGSLDGFGTLKQAVKNGNAEEIGRNVDFHATNPDGSWQYNHKRLARNRAEAQGIGLDEARRSVDEDLRSGKLGKPSPVDLSTLRPEPRPAPEGTAEAPPAEAEADAPPEAKPSPEQNASADPQAAALAEMAAEPVTDPGRSALLKPVENWTEAEHRDAIRAAQNDFTGWRSGDPLKAHLYERAQDWTAYVYGDGPQGFDGGRPVGPQVLRTPPIAPLPHATPSGEDLWQASGRMGQSVLAAADASGLQAAVKALQRGLNLMNDANPLQRPSDAWGPATPLGRLSEDGTYGPETDFAMKHALARLGPAKVEDGLALGRWNGFARQAQASGTPDGLDQATHGIFGPLYRDAGADGPKPEAGVLQQTLNDLGGKAFDDWTPLAVDDAIGPKTTKAFGRVLQAEDADTVTEQFGRGLGLL
ncbi:MAG: hypothetical protein ACM31L_16245 [Actinomycetota bacterium]